jgi:hypothetical protein
MIPDKVPGSVVRVGFHIFLYIMIRVIIEANTSFMAECPSWFRIHRCLNQRFDRLVVMSSTIVTHKEVI